MILKKNRKRVDLEHRRRRKRILWLLVAAVIVGYFSFLLVFNEKGLMKFVEVSRIHRHLAEEIKRLEQRNEELRQRAQALKSDSDTIETIARQELGLAKKGELIYQFQGETGP